MSLFICLYCLKECKNTNSLKNHERCCPSNNNRNYKNGMTGKKGSNQYIKAKIMGLEKPIYDRSHLSLSGCAAASSEQKSIWAKEAKTGGYKPNAGRSKKFRVKDSFDNDVVLQSSYELECSLLLDNLKIKWIRPKHLKYNDKKYFADFYLTEYDLYLDPKNDYKAKLDESKIKSVIEQNNVKVHILKKENITEQYILMLVSPNGEGFG